MHLDVPQDGWTNEESYFIRFTMINIYCKIKKPIDKFIFIAIYESQYTQEELGKMLNVSQEAISKRYNNVLIRLRKFKKNGIL